MINQGLYSLRSEGFDLRTQNRYKSLASHREEEASGAHEVSVRSVSWVSGRLTLKNVAGSKQQSGR